LNGGETTSRRVMHGQICEDAPLFARSHEQRRLFLRFGDAREEHPVLPDPPPVAHPFDIECGQPVDLIDLRGVRPEASRGRRDEPAAPTELHVPPLFETPPRRTPLAPQ
jgi:hypothetical protein